MEDGGWRIDNIFRINTYLSGAGLKMYCSTGAERRFLIKYRQGYRKGAAFAKNAF